MDIINEFHKRHRKDIELRGRTYRAPIPPIVCKDGFTISVQASEHSYCSPRVTDDIAYYEFECGFPSGPVRALAEWKDDTSADDTQTVYGYVPVDVLLSLIDSHGGIKGAVGQTP